MGKSSKVVPWVFALVIFVGVPGCLRDDPRHACTVIGCGPALTVRSGVPGSLAELHGATLEICRNAACISGALTDPSVDTNAPGIVFAASGSGNPHADGFLTRSATGGYRLEVWYWPWSPGDLADGDAYGLVVRDGTGHVITSVNDTVRYQRSYPNGKDCDPRPCLSALIVATSVDDGGAHADGDDPGS